MIVTCSIDERDVDAAAAAAGWIVQVHPEISVRFMAGEAVLESESARPDRMRSLWRVAILNKRLVAAARPTRLEILGQLAG
jgi:hypothetical protein